MVGWIPFIRYAYRGKDGYNPSDAEQYANKNPVVEALFFVGAVLVLVGLFVFLLLSLIGIVLLVVALVMARRARRRYFRQYRSRDPGIPAYAAGGYADWGTAKPAYRNESDRDFGSR